MSALTLTLFGSPCLARDGAPIHLRSRKCIALLAYLAVTGVSHTRARLAALFWPESDARRALGALRYTLWLLRQALQDAWLVVDREAIGLDGSERAAVDVLAYRDLLAQCRTHDHPAQETCPACRPLLAEAVDLYQDHFMAGFTLRDSPEFDDWQRFEAQALRQEQAVALEHLTEACAHQGDIEAAVAYALRRVASDPLHEPAHRTLMRLYVHSGQRAAALHQYETCEEILQTELGESPDQTTIALYQAIKERRLGQRMATASATPEEKGQERLPLPWNQESYRHNLPPEPTPFVGRQAELAQIAQLLADSGCRLLSIVGTGGMGKSRLALRAGMAQVQRFPQGVCLVLLDPIESPELLASAILSALDIPSHGSLPPRMQLLNVLSKRQLLLILDNFEHLLEGATLVAEILEKAPGVKVLVTSRERLNLREEWLLPLEGMRFPTAEKTEGIREEEAASIWEGAISEASASGLEGYAAIQLFVQCARRVRPDFSLLTAGASSVAHICRLVEGMPLAIELAAPWARVMPCRDLAGEIEASLAILASSLRHVPHRHRSMRAVFDHSWGLLPVEERDVLRKLSVFRGGFRRGAAEAVAEAPLAALSSLTDSSWLRATPSGRYDMHPLIRQYCEEHLEQDLEESERARDRHSDYYAGFLDEREARLKGRGQKEALQEILEDTGNVRAVWSWAIARGDVETLGRSVESLWLVSERRGWYREMEQEFSRAAAKLREQLDLIRPDQRPPRAEDTAIVLTQVLCCQAHHRFRFGSVERAVLLLEESLALLHDLDRSTRRAKASARTKVMLGWILDHIVARDRPRANQLLQEALNEATEAGDRWNSVHAAWSLGISALHSGQYLRAEAYLRRAIAITDESGDLWWRAWCLDVLSQVLWAKGEYRAALSLYEERYQISQEIGDRVGVSYALLRLGKTVAALGEYDLARQHYQDSLTIARETSDPFVELESLMAQASVASALAEHAKARELFEKGLSLAMDVPRQLDILVGLGHATLALGETRRSGECFQEALKLAVRTRSIPQTLGALTGMAHLLAYEAESERALELLALVLQHPATFHVTKDKARALLAELESALSPEAIATAMERGRGHDLQHVIAETLGEWAMVPHRGEAETAAER